MGTRSQSDVIGVVLLTVIVSLTVTATGAVTLTEWQNDLGGDPVTDIESELAVDRVELEHFGGDELNASETVVLLDGKRTIPLEEFDGVGDQFVGGMQISNDEFEPLAGDVSLRVVHEPSQSVVHSETFGLEFLLLVEGETGPVFMYEEPSINYTLSDDAELTGSDATVIDLDEDDSTITGTRTGETTLTADDGEETQTIDLSVIEPDELGVTTVETNALGSDRIELTSELTELGALDETELFIRYRQQRPVEFNGKPDDNGDEVIAHGEFTEDEDPDGYTHDGRWVHDNTRLLPGTNRTYEYYAESQVSEIVATLRSEPETEETFESEEFAIEGIGDFDFIRDDNNVPVGEPFEITVEYTDDSEEVRVYVEGQHEWTWDNTNNIGDYDELYFSTREGGNTLRLVSSPTIGSERTEFVDTTDSATSFTGSVSGLQPDTAYFVEAYAEREINGQTINTTGETVAIQTEKLVETREPTAVGAESVRFEGELLESLGETDLSFVVETPDGTEVANTTAATGLDSSRTFSTTVHGLEPNSSYVYYARAVESGGAAPKITGTGQEVPFTTDEPVIVTLDRRATGPNSIEVDGELTNIAELDEMDLSVRYRTQRSVGFTSDPEEDELIGAGGFQTDPAGYAHDTWVHDNTPLYPGTNRTYEYLAGSDTAVIVGALRDEPTDDTSDSNAIDEIGDWDDFIQDSDKIPRGEPFEITVEYTDDGEEVRVYVAGELNQTWDSSENIGDYDELYFTTGDSGEPPEGLRVVSAPTFSEPQFEFAETTTTAPTPFTAEISGLEAGTVYAVEATPSGRSTTKRSLRPARRWLSIQRSDSSGGCDRRDFSRFTAYSHQ
ncbi:type IV pilin N-terminal domain-containing protein [Halohasta litorea]|uniref:Type IV pilin N-terminal domain-containing protein n=1 Tax=Halohasta litorea TaxID=869891 RepID=A0ABD6DAM8_9EURY|nr:type IV pilin N-terminal domain-containing protein [Halohasta litorea]